MLRRMMLGEISYHTAQLELLVRIEYEDMDARETVKARGFQWDRSDRVWRSRMMSQDEFATEVRELMNAGFVVTDQFLEGVDGMLMLAGIIDEEVPVLAGPLLTVPFESRETRSYIFTAGDVTNVNGHRFQHGTMVRKNYRVRTLEPKEG